MLVLLAFAGLWLTGSVQEWIGGRAGATAPLTVAPRLTPTASSEPASRAVSVPTTTPAERTVERTPASLATALSTAPATYSPATATPPLANTLPPGESGCPGAPPQRVQQGERARVCTAYDRLIVRVRPQASSAEVARLDPGTYVTIVDGPQCADDWSWWKIEMDSGEYGWVAEGGDSVDPYFICPAR